MDFCEGRGLSTPPKTDLSLSNTMEVSIFTEVMVLLRRHAVLTVRDPTIYLGRAMVNFMSCLFFAIVYIESRNYVQEQVRARECRVRRRGGEQSALWNPSPPFTFTCELGKCCDRVFEFKGSPLN